MGKVAWNTPPSGRADRAVLSERTVQILREAEDSIRNGGRPQPSGDRTVHNAEVVNIKSAK